MKNKIITTITSLTNNAKRTHSLIKVANETGQVIQKGLSKPTSSTGTPINQLKGGARFMAQLSNIGGGSVEKGGGGIKKGFNTLMAYRAATAKLEEASKPLKKLK